MTITSTSITEMSLSGKNMNKNMNMNNDEDKNMEDDDKENRIKNEILEKEEEMDESESAKLKSDSSSQTEESELELYEPRLKKCYRTMEVIFLPGAKFGAIFMMWVLFHNISANIYAAYCAPLSIGGVFQTMIVSQSPHCKLLRYSIDIGVDVIYSIWGVVALWVSSTILHIYPNIRTSKSVHKMREYHNVS